MQNNFSYPLKLEDISVNGKHYDFQASDDELLYIAEILKVPSVKSFAASLDVKLNKAENLVDVRGKIKAAVEHLSVITLEAFIKKYHFNFARTFSTTMTLAQQRELDSFEDINTDIPDIMPQGQIDIKAISLEALALELDDFPRQKNEVFTFKPDFDVGENEQRKPFAVLEKLKK